MPPIERREEPRRPVLASLLGSRPYYMSDRQSSPLQAAGCTHGASEITSCETTLMTREDRIVPQRIPMVHYRITKEFLERENERILMGLAEPGLALVAFPGTNREQKKAQTGSREGARPPFTETILLNALSKAFGDPSGGPRANVPSRAAAPPWLPSVHGRPGEQVLAVVALELRRRASFVARCGRRFSIVSPDHSRGRRHDDSPAAIPGRIDADPKVR